MSKSKKVYLQSPAECDNGSVLSPGWYDREEVPEAAFTIGLVYVPPDIPVPGAVPDPKDTDVQSKQRGKNL